jgi:hypothetical protein
VVARKEEAIKKLAATCILNFIAFILRILLALKSVNRLRTGGPQNLPVTLRV